MIETQKTVEQTVYELEKQILHFLIKNTRYIEKIFSNKKITTKVFSRPNTKTLADAICSYFGVHKSCIVLGSLKDFLLEVNSKNKNFDPITDLNEPIQLFETIEQDYEMLEDERFDEIFKNWISAYNAKILEPIIKNSIENINNLCGDDAVEYISDQISRNIINSKKESCLVSASDANKDYKSLIQDLENRRLSRFSLLKTGFRSLDAKFNGYEPGSLSVIGGVTGSGKSTAILNLSNQHFLNGKKVLAITLEMAEDQWKRRLLSINLRIPYSDLLNGFVNYSEEERIQKYKEIEEWSKDSAPNYKVYFATARSQTWREITEEIDKSFLGFEPDVIYVDQLSLIDISCYKQKDKRDALGDLTKDIRSYAQLRKTRIIAAVQANRSSITKGKDGTKTIEIGIENIEDSNQIGADADNFIAIRKEGNTLLYFDIVKQREGETGVNVDMGVLPEFMAIYDKTSDFPSVPLSQNKEKDISSDVIDEITMNTKEGSVFEKETDYFSFDEDEENSISKGQSDLLKEEPDGSKEESDLFKEEPYVSNSVIEKEKKNLPINDPEIRRLILLNGKDIKDDDGPNYNNL